MALLVHYSESKLLHILMHHDSPKEEVNLNVTETDDVSEYSR